MQKLIKQKEFAALAGVTPAAITQIKNRLGAALVGKKIDVNHPLAQAYLEERKAKQSKTPAPGFPEIPREKIGGMEDGQIVLSDSLARKSEIPSDLAGLTLGEIVERFGSVPEFSSYVKAQTNLEDYQTKRAKRRELRGKLINKEHEARVVFGIVEALSRRLLTDIPQTLSRRVVAIAFQEPVEADYRVQEEIKAANSNALKICQNALLRRLDAEEDAVLFGKYKKDFSMPEIKIPMEILR